MHIKEGPASFFIDLVPHTCLQSSGIVNGMMMIESVEKLYLQINALAFRFFRNGTPATDAQSCYIERKPSFLGGS